MQPLTYLALGDSYTVGESVRLYQSFPYQAVQLLREKGLPVTGTEIVAATAWTTAELEEGMRTYRFLPAYGFVSLLIGVNNQYREQPLEQYAEQFERLLKKAVGLAGGNPLRTFVVSIPDYGVTPEGQKLDPEKIRKEIDAFNRAARDISSQYHTHYIDITPGSREGKADPSLVAADGLHPSALEYAKWAAQLAEAVLKEVS